MYRCSSTQDCSVKLHVDLPFPPPLPPPSSTAICVSDSAPNSAIDLPLTNSYQTDDDDCSLVSASLPTGATAASLPVLNPIEDKQCTAKNVVCTQ